MPPNNISPEEKKKRLALLVREHNDLGLFFDFVDSFPEEKDKLKPGEYEAKQKREKEIEAEVNALNAQSGYTAE